MSSQALPIYPVTLMVQSSCTFYRDLICKLFEYASPCSISLRESEAGERGGGFWEHKICWAPGRHFNLSRLEASWVLWGSASACSLPRQGGVWITLRALKADICLPWAWGAARCCLLGLLWLAWGLHNSAHRSGCSWLGCSTLWQQALPGASPSTLQSCWELWLQRCWRCAHLGLSGEAGPSPQPCHTDRALGSCIWTARNRQLLGLGNFGWSVGGGWRLRPQTKLIFPQAAKGEV